MNPEARSYDDEFLNEFHGFDEGKWRRHLNFEARVGYDAWLAVNSQGPANRDFPNAAYYEKVGQRMLVSPTMGPIMSTLKAIQKKITQFLKEEKAKSNGE